MDAFGVEFGKIIGQLVTGYRTTFAWVALLWHVSTFALLYLVIASKGNTPHIDLTPRQQVYRTEY
jgi:predicted MFS family arabinose efflux permease